MNKQEFLETINFDERGLVVAIAQDYHSKHIRMQAYMNKEALERTIDTGNVYYYSRSRKKLWLKGEESGNFQFLKGISVDCDGDAVLLQIEQKNNISCHTGNSSCFFRSLEKEDLCNLENKEIIKKNIGSNAFEKLSFIAHDRRVNPKVGSYTNYLYNQGIDKVLKKIGEETSEVIIASKNKDKSEVIFEIADLIYHLAILLEIKDLSFLEIEEELDKR